MDTPNAKPANPITRLAGMLKALRLGVMGLGQTAARLRASLAAVGGGTASLEAAPVATKGSRDNDPGTGTERTKRRRRQGRKRRVPIAGHLVLLLLALAGCEPNADVLRAATSSAYRWANAHYPGRADPARATCGTAHFAVCGGDAWCDVDTDGAIVPLCCDASTCRVRGPAVR